MYTAYVTLLLVIGHAGSSSERKIVTFTVDDNLGSPLVQGSDVTMVCTASGYSGDIGQHIQVIKTIVPSDGNGPIHVTMVTNMQINNEYATLVDKGGIKRYSSELEVVRSSNATTAILTFKLNAITGTDVGSYNCSVSYGNNEIIIAEKSINLQIQGRLDTIHWFKRSPDGSIDDINGEILTVAPPTNLTLVCATTALGTLVQPQFDVHFTENNRKVGITSWFVSDAPRDEVVRIPGKAYTFNITSRRSISYGLEKPDRRLDKKLVVCEATSPGSYETLRALLTLRIEYPPTLSCTKKSDPFGIKCSAEGNPLPVITMVTASNKTISSEDLPGTSAMTWQHYILEKTVTGNFIELSLSSNMTVYNLGSLVVKATNIHGSLSTAKIELQKDVYTSSCDCLHLNTSVVLVLLLIGLRHFSHDIWCS